jgi:hypothetical protein
MAVVLPERSGTIKKGNAEAFPFWFCKQLFLAGLSRQILGFYFISIILRTCRKLRLCS